MKDFFHERMHKNFACLGTENSCNCYINTFILGFALFNMIQQWFYNHFTVSCILFYCSLQSWCLLRQENLFRVVIILVLTILWGGVELRSYRCRFAFFFCNRTRVVVQGSEQNIVCWHWIVLITCLLMNEVCKYEDYISSCNRSSNYIESRSCCCCCCGRRSSSCNDHHNSNNNNNYSNKCVEVWLAWEGKWNWRASVTGMKEDDKSGINIADRQIR